MLIGSRRRRASAEGWVGRESRSFAGRGRKGFSSHRDGELRPVSPRPLLTASGDGQTGAPLAADHEAPRLAAMAKESADQLVAGCIVEFERALAAERRRMALRSGAAVFWPPAFSSPAVCGSANARAPAPPQSRNRQASSIDR